MFFFLRCVFWLSIVYASISWPTGTFEAVTPRLPDLGVRAIAMGRAEVATLAAQGFAAQGFAAQGLGARGLAAVAGPGIADLCSRHRVECLEDARRLTSLIAAGDAPEALVAPTPASVEVPLPVPDPRRAGRGAKRPATP